MKTLRNLLTFCTVLAVFCLIGSAVVAQEQPASQDLKVASGELISVDPDASLITIRTEDAEELQFRYDDATEIIGGGGTTEGLATMNGKQITVHYRVEEEQATAVKIEVNPQAGA